MREVSAGYHNVYEYGDTIRFITPEYISRFGTGSHRVKRGGHDTVIVVVTLEVTLPNEQVTLHENRPAYMEPDYVKCG